MMEKEEANRLEKEKSKRMAEFREETEKEMKEKLYMMEKKLSEEVQYRDWETDRKSVV